MPPATVFETGTTTSPEPIGLGLGVLGPDPAVNPRLSPRPGGDRGDMAEIVGPVRLVAFWSNMDTYWGLDQGVRNPAGNAKEEKDRPTLGGAGEA